MRLGYNSNGFPFHRWQDGLELLASLGYRSVAITVDTHWLDPFSPRFDEELQRTRDVLQRLQLRSVVETGARYLLDPAVKHAPTLMTADPDERLVRVDFLMRCIDVAAALESDAVSFWSGVLREELSESAAYERLAEGCRKVIDYAGEQDVRLAFEPEPGMFVETMADYARLLDRVDAPHFGLTIDVGHLQCVEAPPIDRYLRAWSPRLFNVHVEDMVRGVHEHLRFGEGEIDFEPVLRALHETAYSGGLHVELSRHGHAAPEVMRESFAFLDGLLREIEAGG